MRVWLGECLPRSVHALQFLEDVAIARDLPARWEIRRQGDGRTYYLDQNTGSTTWERPKNPLPVGWEEKKEGSRTYYVDHNTNSTSWTRPGELPFERQSVPGIGSTQVPLVMKKNDPKAFTDIAILPWWRRLWVVQEVVLAETVTFHLGSKNVEFSSLFDGLRWFQQAYQIQYTSMYECWRINEAEESESFISFYNALMSLDTRKTFERLSEDWKIFIVRLGTLRGRIASEDKDKVYGLLGLCPSALRERMSPDYTSSCREVYQNFAFQVISASDSLELFGQTMPSQNLIPGLPSWVPDWTSKHNFTPVANRLQELGYLFNCCGHHALKVSSIEDGILCLHGVLFDAVVQTGTPFPASIPSVQELCQIYSEWQRVCDVDSPWKEQSRYVMGGSVGDAFWRTMLNDAICPWIGNNARRCEHDDWQRYLQWLQEFNMCKASDPDIDLSRHTATVDRRMIIGKKGYFGLAPKDTVPGDIIWIIAGGKVPNILRPSPNATRRDTFTLVGEGAYIHGIMDGQAFTGPSTTSELSPEEQSRLKEFGGHAPDPDSGHRVMEEIFIE